MATLFGMFPPFLKTGSSLTADIKDRTLRKRLQKSFAASRH